jgi:hypothetical protein
LLTELRSDYFKWLQWLKKLPAGLSQVGSEYMLLGVAIGIEHLEMSPAVSILDRWNAERSAHCNERDGTTTTAFSSADLEQSAAQVRKALLYMLKYHEDLALTFQFPLNSRLLPFCHELIIGQSPVKWPIQFDYLGRGLIDMLAAVSLPRVCYRPQLTQRDSWIDAIKIQHPGISALCPADLSFEKRWLMGSDMSIDEEKEELIRAIDWFASTFLAGNTG